MKKIYKLPEWTGQMRAAFKVAGQLNDGLNNRSQPLGDLTTEQPRYREEQVQTPKGRSDSVQAQLAQSHVSMGESGTR